MKKYVARVLIVGALILLIFLGFYYGKQYLSLGALQIRSAHLHTLVERHYFQSLCIYVIIYSAIIIVGLPVTGPFTLLGGYLFGAIIAFLCSLISIACGMITAFLIIRSFFLPTLRIKFAKQQTKFAERMQTYGSTYLLTLNMLTIVPFVLINALAALSNVSVWSVLWTSVVGSMPMVLIYACAGKKFAELTRISDIFSPTIIILLVILVALSAIPLIMKRLKYIRDLDE